MLINVLLSRSPFTAHYVVLRCGSSKTDVLYKSLRTDVYKPVSYTHLLLNTMVIEFKVGWTSTTGDSTCI